MTPPDLSSALAIVQDVARQHTGLELLVVHGSRARKDAHEGSDWDFAYLASPPFDPSLLHADLAMALSTDKIDLANLASASGLLRYRVARDGIPLFEASPGSFDRFWFQAVSFWCDAQHVLRAGFKSVLDELGP